ncbi:hypothetical protein [Nonomuraea sp. NPDC050783]|uniref:hypothetical protein n=1 Tax=Nonomuraea sp. NPDC050783 TaxID=3154634 RepID=UPI003465BB7E
MSTTGVQEFAEYDSCPAVALSLASPEVLRVCRMSTSQKARPPQESTLPLQGEETRLFRREAVALE